MPGNTSRDSKNCPHSHQPWAHSRVTGHYSHTRFTVGQPSPYVPNSHFLSVLDRKVDSRRPCSHPVPPRMVGGGGYEAHTCLPGWWEENVHNGDQRGGTRDGGEGIPLHTVRVPWEAGTLPYVPHFLLPGTPRCATLPSSSLPTLCTMRSDDTLGSERKKPMGERD